MNGFSLLGSNTTSRWKLPLAVIAVFSFIGFILGCVATNSALKNKADITNLRNKNNNNDDEDICADGDILFGGQVHVAQNGIGGYQVIGDLHGHINWHDAYADANSRCYNGYQGYLAMIGDEWENSFITSIIETYGNGHKAVWIGGTDLEDEATFEWVGNGKLGTGIIFYQNGEPYNGAYNNFNGVQPSSVNGSGVNNDCIAMYQNSGEWFDNPCYMKKPFFVVEFGPISVADIWNDQHDDKLDDDQFT